MEASILLPLLTLQLVTVAAGLLLLKRLPQRSVSGPLPPLAVLAICTALAAGILALSDPTRLLNDFRKAYYVAGRAVLDDATALAPLIEMKVTGFVNLPIVAYLFAPFAMLPPLVAAALFTGIGLAAVFGAWFGLVRYAGLEGRERWLLLLLFAGNGPLLYSIKEGNTSHIVLAALVGGMWLLRERRDVAAGAVFGIAALIKLPMLLFGVYFVLRRHWSAVASFAAVCAVAGLLSLAVFGWELHVRWFELCILEFNRNSIGAFNDQSIRGFLARIFSTPDILQQWTGRPQETTQHFLGGMLIGLAYLAVLLACWRPKLDAGHTDPAADYPVRDLELQLVLTLALVTSPVSWTHYYVWLLIPIALSLGKRSTIAQSSSAIRFMWVATILTLPAVKLATFANPFLETVYAKAVVSHALLGGLIWLGLLAWARTNAARSDYHVGTEPALSPRG